MKRRLFPLAAVALLLCMLFFIFSPSTAHADALDPYDSGCANTGYVANSGTLSVAGYVVYAEKRFCQKLEEEAPCATSSFQD